MELVIWDHPWCKEETRSTRCFGTHSSSKAHAMKAGMMSESYTRSAEGLRQDCQLGDSSSDRGNLSNKWNINMKLINLKMGIPHCITDQFCLIHTIFPEEWANDKANSISSTSEANCVKYTEEATNREYNKLVRGEFKILFSKINLLSPLLFISIYNSWCTTHKTAVYKDNSHVSKHTWECVQKCFPTSCGPPNNGSGRASDSFVRTWGPFPPTGLLHPAMVWGSASSLIISC